MNSTKRGMVVVVLVVFLLVFGVIGFDEPTGDDISDETSDPFAWYVGYMKDKSDSSTNSNFKFRDSIMTNNYCEGELGVNSDDVEWNEDDQNGIDPPNDCGTAPCCALQFVKHDGGGYDECSGRYARGGQIIHGHIAVPYDQSAGFNNWFNWEDGHNKDTLKAYTLTSSYICDANVWKECNQQTVGSFLDVLSIETEGDDEEVTSVKEVNTPYFCVAKFSGNTLVYSWETFPDPSVDKDDDGVPVAFDCDDNDRTVYGDFSRFDENAPEPQIVCGDGKPNTCGFIADETDECDDDEFACRNNCLGFGSLDCDWLKTASGGMCCGDDGLEDLGEIREHETAGSHVCLSSEPGLVGSANGIPFEASETSGTEFEPGDGQWRWISATGDDNTKFTPFTIKKVGEKPFDVISNNAQWFVCSESRQDIVTAPTFAPEGMTLADATEKSNRFNCFDGGNYWGFAECSDEFTDKGTVKSRLEGDGLYSLFIQNADAQEEAYGEIIAVNTRDGKYKEFYGDEATFDFTGYTHLEFFVQFARGPDDILSRDELQLPVNVFVEIRGPKQGDEEVLYLREPVLGYVTHGPYFENSEHDTWMHVRMPVPELVGVEQIKIFSNDKDRNPVGVRNVFLSREGETQFCSGINSVNGTAWIANPDEGSNHVDGEFLCKALYGETAWLGEDSDVAVSSASCCGNEENEYYAGRSLDIEGSNYGCWNSQPVARDSTIMDVQVDVISSHEEIQVTYPQETFDVIVNESFLEIVQSTTIQEDQVDDTVNTLADLRDEVGSYLVREDELVYEVVQRETAHTYTGNQISLLTSPLVIDVLHFNKSKFKMPSREHVGEITVHVSGSNAVSVSLIDSYDGVDYDERIAATGLMWEKTAFNIVATLNSNYEVQSTPQGPQEKQEIKTYSCSSDECLFPLPGLAPYSIKNPNPDLYELYFVTGDSPEEEIIIGSEYKNFEQEGNLKAKKVPQQVIFDGEQFFGCSAADYVEVNLNDNLAHCAVKGDKFCAFSVSHEKNKEKFTTINEWSNEEIEEVGYQDISAGDSNVSIVYDSIELQLRKLEDPEKPLPATDRTHIATVLPSRNFISNALFERTGNELAHWEIISNDIYVIDEFHDFITEDFVGPNTVDLKEGDILKSERIPVNESGSYEFTFNGTADFLLILIDKNGKRVEVITTQGEFETQDISYMILEFTKGIVTTPLLQRIDSFGPEPFTYTQQYAARSGASCCPENYCWNGYSCVEPMGESTLLAENVGEGRFYRCIEGNWESLPVKWDWNAQDWGFCSEPNSCFVLRESKGASASASAQSFYDGQYPTCVSDGEYIFDHLCEQGEWTSRTKFVATELLEVAGDKDALVYCTNYRDALLHTDFKDDFIGGGQRFIIQEEQGLGDAIGDEPVVQEAGFSCFPKISGEGERLVPQEQNTCVNNFCILRYDKPGDFKTEFKVAFATTLNRPINHPESFVHALEISPTDVGVDCISSADESFIECDLDSLSGDFWYSSDIEGVIYGKEGISLDPSLWQQIQDWFAGLFDSDSELADSKAFVEEATNFNELYILQGDGKQVRAMKEKFPGVKERIVAEYSGFDTPVCEYLEHRDLPPELESELLEIASDLEKIDCSVTVTAQTAEAVAGLDFLWPQLTGQLRPQMVQEVQE